MGLFHGFAKDGLFIVFTYQISVALYFPVFVFNCKSLHLTYGQSNWTKLGEPTGGILGEPAEAALGTASLRSSARTLQVSLVRKKKGSSRHALLE